MNTVPHGSKTQGKVESRSKTNSYGFTALSATMVNYEHVQSVFYVAMIDNEQF
jgi:hypothetical protein